MSDYGKLGPDDDYCYECPMCMRASRDHPDREFASYSRDARVIRRAAENHHKKYGCWVVVYFRKAVEVLGRVPGREP